MPVSRLAGRPSLAEGAVAAVARVGLMLLLPLASAAVAAAVVVAAPVEDLLAAA